VPLDIELLREKAEEMKQKCLEYFKNKQNSKSNDDDEYNYSNEEIRKKYFP
jgi:hypothetical protein